MFRHVSAIMCLCGFVGSIFLLLILLGYTGFYFFLFHLAVFFYCQWQVLCCKVMLLALAMFMTIFILVHFYFQLKEQHLPTEQCALEFNSIHSESIGIGHIQTRFMPLQYVSYLVAFFLKRISHHTLVLLNTLFFGGFHHRCMERWSFVANHWKYLEELQEIYLKINNFKLNK